MTFIHSVLGYEKR